MQAHCRGTRKQKIGTLFECVEQGKEEGSLEKAKRRRGEENERG